jgi:hypothetical protein
MERDDAAVVRDVICERLELRRDVVAAFGERDAVTNNDATRACGAEGGGCEWGVPEWCIKAVQDCLIGDGEFNKIVIVERN